MTVTARIEADIKAALKAGDKVRVACLRMLKARLLEREIDARSARGPRAQLTDEEAQEAIAAYAKQRRDSIESYAGAGRDDLADRERAELTIVTEYLPQQLEEAQIREIVVRAVEESGASSTRELGQVMKIVMPQVKGRADGKLVNRIVREALSGLRR